MTPIEGKYYDCPPRLSRWAQAAGFLEAEDHTLAETNFYYFADGTAHKNRMQGNDFMQSVMYRRGITCFDCHDVHGTNNYAQRTKSADKPLFAWNATDRFRPTGPERPRSKSTRTIRTAAPEAMRGLPHAGD